MSEEKKRILDLLASGKINASEAESLINATDKSTPTPPNNSIGGNAKLVNYGVNNVPKFLRVQIISKTADKSGEKVNIKVPFQLLRSGIKLASLIPSGVESKVNHALNEKGINFDISQLAGKNMDELVESFADLSIDVENDREHIRIFCE